MGKIVNTYGTWLITYHAVWDAGFPSTGALYNAQASVTDWNSLDDPFFIQPNGIHTPTYLKSVIESTRQEIWSFQAHITMVNKSFTPTGTRIECSYDSCRVDCASQPDGFCCIDHSKTDRLLQVLASS